MHVALRFGFGPELARLRVAELQARHAANERRRQTRRPIPRRTGD
jgi:hypothetical protein